MRWSQIEARQPALAAIAHEHLIKPGVLLVGTTRRDGTARISGAEPLVLDGRLLLSMMQTSTKAHDLQRDPRILLHSPITTSDAAPEIKVRGTAEPEPGLGTHHRYAEAVAAELGWRPVVGRFSLYDIDIDDVTYIGYAQENGAQHVARWPADVEYLRPATTPTSLGPPEPIRRLLAS